MRGKFLDDYTPGEIIETPGKTVTEADVYMFAGLTGDYNELHTNREAMKESQFGERLVHGLLGLSMGIGLFFTELAPWWEQSWHFLEFWSGNLPVPSSLEIPSPPNSR